MVDYTYKLDLDEPVEMGSRFRDQRQGIGAQPKKEEPEADSWADMFYGLLKGYFGDEDEAKKALTTAPEQPSYDMDDALQTLKSVNLPSRISEPIIEGVPEKPEMGSREPFKLEVDTIGNEALDRSGMRLVDVTDTEQGKLTNEEPLYKLSEEIDPGTIDVSELPSGKGLMSPVDDDMGLPTTPSKQERELSGSVKRVQQKLTDLGYKPKGIDGVIGGGTRRAIRKFQKANDLPITGELTQEVLDIIDSGNAPKYFDPPKPNAKVDSFTDQSFTIFADAIADKESSNRYNITGGANDHYLGRYQMGKDALADVGRGYNAKLNKEFLNNPELQDKLFKKYTLMNHKHLTKNSKRYREMSQQEKLGVLGYAHNQGATAAEEWLYTGVSGADAFGTKGDEYTSLVRKAFNDYLKDLKPQLRPDKEEV